MFVQTQEVCFWYNISSHIKLVQINQTLYVSSRDCSKTFFNIAAQQCVLYIHQFSGNIARGRKSEQLKNLVFLSSKLQEKTFKHSNLI